MGAWISLEQLADTLRGNYHEIDGFKSESSMLMLDKSNCKVNTDVLYPYYRFNKHGEGFGKGHWLASKYILKQHGMNFE